MGSAKSLHHGVRASRRIETPEPFGELRLDQLEERKKTNIESIVKAYSLDLNWREKDQIIDRLYREKDLIEIEIRKLTQKDQPSKEEYRKDSLK